MSADGFHQKIDKGENVYPIPIKSTYKDFEKLDDIVVFKRNGVELIDGEYPIIKDAEGKPKKIYLKTVLWLKDPRLLDENNHHINTLCITTTESGGEEPRNTCNIFNNNTKNLIEFDSEEDPNIFHGMVGFRIKFFNTILSIFIHPPSINI